MKHRFLLVLFTLVMFSVVAAGASELEPLDIDLGSEVVPVEQTEVSDQLPSTEAAGENLLAGIELSSANQCQHETCDVSIECWESCEAQHPFCPENGDNFCWCVRACADICI